MPAPRRSKKVLIQFAVALLVAVGLGIGVLAAGLGIIGEVSKQAQQAQQTAQQKAAELADRERQLKAREENLSGQPRTFKAVQAITDLVPGRPITQDMVMLATLDERPPVGSLNMLSQAIGKIARAPIMKGETLESSKLLDLGGYVNVQEGMRAMTIHVDSVAGLNGSLIPGAHVDILTTIARNDSSITRTILQNIPVAAVSGGATPLDNLQAGGLSAAAGNLAQAAKPASGSDKGMSITVIVTPRQAEVLTLASTLGSFHLTLRNFNDRRASRMQGADLTTLITGLQPGSKAGKPPTPPRFPRSSAFQPAHYSPEDVTLPTSSSGVAAPKFSMRIYRGTGSETVDFQQ